MEISAALQALLDEGSRHEAQAGDGQARRRPTMLIALERLGADEARLREWAAGCEGRLQPARPPVPWPAGDAWTGRLGRREAGPVYRDLYTQWIGHEGAADMLEQVLPALMPGCAAAGFEGLVRTAYAVQVGHLGELADGLALWSASHLPLGELPEVAAGEADPIALLRQLPAGGSRAPDLATRLRAAARGGTVNRAVASLAIDAATPTRLARAAAHAYAESGNGGAAQLVVASHAALVLERFHADEDARQAARRWFWQAWAHGVVAARLAVAAPVDARPWDEIVSRACACDDALSVTLVDCARQLARRGVGGGADAASGADADDALWRRAATRALGPAARR